MTSLSLTNMPLKARNWAAQIGIALTLMLVAILLVFFGLKQPLIPAAAVYVAAFLTMAWKRPQWALLAIFAAAPFQSDVGGGGFAKFSMAEVNLTLTFPVFLAHLLIKKRLPAVGPLVVPVLFYLGICIYSSSADWHGHDALISIIQMALYFFVAVSVFASFVERLEDMRIALYALVWVGLFLAIAAVVTSFGFMGMNKNGIGGSIACSLLVGAELWLSENSPQRRKWLMIAMVFLTIILFLSLSRGAWLGAVIGLMSIFALRKQWRTLGSLSLVLLPLLTVCWFLLPSEKREYASGFTASHENIRLRYVSVDIARQYYERNPLVGEGVGLRKEYDATNIVWMVLAETGLAGLVAFTLIHLIFFQMIRIARLNLPTSHPQFSFLTIGAALVLNQLSHGMVDHYWSRGPLMTAWAAAGMATGVYLAQRRLTTRGKL